MENLVTKYEALKVVITDMRDAMRKRYLDMPDCPTRRRLVLQENLLSQYISNEYGEASQIRMACLAADNLE